MTQGRGTVVRTWSATADGPGARDYTAYFDGTLLPELRELPGFVGAYLLRRGTVEGGTVEGGTVEGGTVEGGTVEGGTVELTAHTFWESSEAIRAFAGDDITRSVVEPEAQAMLRDYDRTAIHRIVAVDAHG